MSTLQVSTAQITTLSDGTNSTSCTNAIQGSAKAWVNFNGTTSPGTIRASYNVSSVTKNATGNYTVNFANPLQDANYSCVVSAGPFQNSNSNIYSGFRSTNPTSNFSANIGISYLTAGNIFAIDVDYVNVAFFR